MPKRARSGAYKKSGVTINLGAAATKGKRKYKKSSKYPRAQYGRQFIPTGTFINEAGSNWRNANDEQRAWRARNNYYGTGAYGLKDLWKGAKGLVKQHGGKALSFLGGRMGGASGAAAGGAIGKAFGLGRYDMGGVGAYGDVDSNDLVHGGSDDSMAIAQVNPSMEDDSGDVIMSHSEFIGNVVATASIPGGAAPFQQYTAQSTFSNTVYPINPGLQSSFPFLCQLAQNYTMYKLEGIIYQYKPLSGEGGGATNALGKIIMATDYDPMAVPFINSVQMENYQYSQSCKPSLAARHGVETASSQGITEMKYVRTGTSNRDKSFTDYGLFQLATEGIPVTGLQTADPQIMTNNIGELWVSYKVRLSRANLYSSLLGYNIRNDIFNIIIPSTANLSVPLHITEAKHTNNIGCLVKFRTGGTDAVSGKVYPDAFCVEFPASQILGVYKITVMQTATQADPTANTFRSWVPLGTPNDLQTQDEKTQWGCPFTASPNILAEPRTIPKVDLVTGLPVMLGLASCKRYCYFTMEPQDLTLPSQNHTTTYFAINSPTTTIARLAFGLYNFSTSSPYDLMSVASGSMQTNPCGFIISIEQVNAEISNA
jgi:hypothetical protein